MDEASCVVPCAPSSSLRALAEKGWSSRLAAAVSGALGCLGLSGLWNFLAPFSLFSQLLLLAHVLSGLGVTTVVVPYVARHVRTWARQRVTASMFLGYALAAVVLVSLASGVWLGGEALWSRRMTPAWDLTHLVSGLAVLGLVGAHLAAAVQRRWAVSHTAPGFGGGHAGVRPAAGRSGGRHRRSGRVRRLGLAARRPALRPAPRATRCPAMRRHSMSTAATPLRRRTPAPTTSGWWLPSSWPAPHPAAVGGATSRSSPSGSRARIASRR